MLATMVVSFTVPALPVPALAKVVVMLTFYLAFLGFLHHNRAFDPGLDPLSKCALASGIISFWILASPLMALAKGNVGPFVLAGLMAGLLASVPKRLRKGLAS
jgi:ABC-type thiamin/hydroxymethylpyrimidine transport system permease subunit